MQATSPPVLPCPSASPAGVAPLCTSCCLAPLQDLLVWHLMHFVAPCPSACLGMADAEGVQMLTDMLEGGSHARHATRIFASWRTMRTRSSVMESLLRIRSCMHTHIYSREHACTHTHMYTRVSVRSHAYTCTRAREHTHKCVSTRMHTCARTACVCITGHNKVLASEHQMLWWAPGCLPFVDRHSKAALRTVKLSACTSTPVGF